MDKERVTQEFVKHLNEIAGIIHLATLFALLVAALSLLTYAVLALGGRRGDFALLRILGFSAPQVGRMMRREVAVAGGIGVCLSIPLALLLAVGLNALLGRAWLNVGLYLHWGDVAAVSAAGLLMLPVAAWPAVRAVRLLDPVRVLRERRIG
jgi:ABC-type lipoprotein release transport system permease subunit